MMRRARRTREQKYPDTDTFHFYNANPKGKYTCDCVARAVATALDKPWEEVLTEMAVMACKTGYAINSKQNMDRYLQAQGFTRQKQPRKPDNTKYTGEEFCSIFDGMCVANIGGNHVVCIKNGKVNDTWDSTGGCIGNYWTKG